ncbi:MAG: antitoxin [Sciscionella sp.]
MGFDELKKKAKGLFSQHGDKAEQAVDKAGDLAKDKVGHEEQVDKATDKGKDKAKDVVGDSGDQD